MRLVRLDLLAYGPFQGASLDLARPGLHVVFGRNEAGKSTTLRAVTGLFYGIDRNTKDAHVHEPRDLRIGGVLERGDGTRLHVVRRKGNAQTLLDGEGAALPDDALRPFLRAVTEDTFRHAFGLDHESLRRGAEGLLEGKGDLGESLFDASAGGAGEVQRLLASLQASHEALYRPRGTTQAVNQALKAFDAAQKRVSERQSLPQAYVKQEEHLETLRKTSATLVARRDALREEKARLERRKRRAPLERRLAELSEARARLTHLAEAAPRLGVLQVRLGAYDNDLRALASLDAERAIAEGRLQEASRGAGKGARLDARAASKLTKVVHERDAIAARLVEADEAIAKLERERARAESELTTEVIDTSALSRAIERAEALGAEANGEDGVARLDARAKKEEARVARLDDRLSDLAASLQQVERQIAEATGDFAPPEPHTLAEARRLRDEATSRVLHEERVPTRLEAATIDRLVREADDLADRMIREADRVTSLARLRSARQTQETQREALRAERAEAAAARDMTLAELARAFARARADLAQALEDPDPDEGSSLRVLVARARTRLGELEARARAQVETRRSLAAANERLEAHTAARARDAARLEEARAQLGELGVAVGVDARSSADEVLAALEAARGVEVAEAALHEARLRASVASEATAAFEEDVRALVAAFAPDLEGMGPRDAAATLVQRFEEARAVTTEASAIAKQLDELGPRPEGEEAATWAEEDARRLETTAGELDRVEDEASHAQRDIGGAEKGLEMMRGESHAAEAAAEASEALARVRAQVERYCRARLAHAVLAQEIERFRDENQGPLLARASALFARLTLGAFTSVRAEIDEQDRTSLSCVRAGGATAPVEGLSEGTRDQLYLALRLASLERHAETTDPMPLLLDDVLVQLDDERARAALVVLAETASRMQVLFFTHHARLVELAREAVPASALVVHELGARREATAPVPVLVAGSEA